MSLEFQSLCEKLDEAQTSNERQHKVAIIQNLFSVRAPQRTELKTLELATAFSRLFSLVAPTFATRTLAHSIQALWQLDKSRLAYGMKEKALAKVLIAMLDLDAQSPDARALKQWLIFIDLCFNCKDN
jgi:hypothetical protein